MKIFIAIILVLSFSTICFSSEERIVDVVDGDTILLESNGVVAYYAIYGIDAPEISQKYGDEARIFILDKITSKKHKINVKKSYAGEISYIEIYLTDEGQDLSCLMIYSGLAFYDRKLEKNKKENDKYLNSEKFARNSKKGVWAEERIEYPWEYRAANKIKEIEEVEANKSLSDYAMALSKSGGASSSNYENYNECYSAELDMASKKLRGGWLETIGGLQQAKVSVAYYCAGIFGGDVKVKTIQTYSPTNDKFDKIEKKLDDIENRQKYGY